MVGDPDVPFGEYTWPTSLSRVFGLIYSLHKLCSTSYNLLTIKQPLALRTPDCAPQTAKTDTTNVTKRKRKLSGLHCNL